MCILVDYVGYEYYVFVCGYIVGIVFWMWLVGREEYFYDVIFFSLIVIIVECLF